jgi:hypothetical protein
MSHPNVPSKLYYEVHVTIDPPKQEDVDHLQQIANKHGFRMAKLFKLADGSPNEKDAFFTYRSHVNESFEQVKSRMIHFASELEYELFKVQRYKIEDTLLDTKLQGFL